MTERAFRTETLSLLLGVFLAIVGGIVYQSRLDATQTEKLDTIARQLAEIRLDLKAIPNNTAELANHEVRLGSLERDVYKRR